MLLPIALVLAGVVLAILSWPGLVDDLFRRAKKNKEAGAELAAEFEEDLGEYVSAPSAAKLRAVPSRSLIDEARPIEPDAAERRRLAALYEFLDGLESALHRDDPDVWPDAEAGAKDLADATAILHRAELRAERSSPFVEGGARRGGAVQQGGGCPRAGGAAWC